MVPEQFLDYEQQCFPLDIYFCESCHHSQLLDIIDPSDLFEEYVYEVAARYDHFCRFYCFLVDDRLVMIDLKNIFQV